MSLVWSRVLVGVWLAVGTLAIAPTELAAQKGAKEREKAVQHLRHNRPRAAADEFAKCHAANPSDPNCKRSQIELMYRLDSRFHYGEVYPVAREVLLELNKDLETALESNRALLGYVSAYYGLISLRLGTREDIRPLLKMGEAIISRDDEEMTKRISGALGTLDRQSEKTKRHRATHDSIMQVLSMAASGGGPLPVIDLNEIYEDDGMYIDERYPTRVYTVREVVRVDDGEVFVRIDLGRLERVVPGQSGQFIIGNRDQKGWSPKAIGRAEVTEAGKDPLILIRFEPQGGDTYEVQAGDIVTLEAAPDDPAMGSILYGLAQYRIGLVSDVNVPYYDIETLRVAGDTVPASVTLAGMAYDIREFATLMQATSKKLSGDYNAKARKSYVYGDSPRVIEAMEWTGTTTVNSFFRDLNRQKEWFMGRDWPLHELFAKWVRTGSVR